MRVVWPRNMVSELLFRFCGFMSGYRSEKVFLAALAKKRRTAALRLQSISFN